MGQHGKRKGQPYKIVPTIHKEPVRTKDQIGIDWLGDTIPDERLRTPMHPNGGGDVSNWAFQSKKKKMGYTTETYSPPVRSADTPLSQAEKVATRLYVRVPYRRKDEAKGMKARWDPDLELWFFDRRSQVPDVVTALFDELVLFDEPRRQYLNVPYEHKDTAKAAGARWDPGRKKWYLVNAYPTTFRTEWFV
jgi:hypothetical protein